MKRPGIRLGVASVAIVLIAGVLITGRIVPGLANPALAYVTGLGNAFSDAIPIRAGWAKIRWDIADVQRPRNGCVFGLRVAWLDPPPARPKEVSERIGPGELAFRCSRGQLPKLDYRAITAGSRRSTTTLPIEFVAGTYQFVVDGSCGWRVSVYGSEPASYPSAEPAPRMG